LSKCSFSNEEKGHYQFQIGEVLDGIYEITKLLGEGTFGRVVEGRRNNKLYAIKVFILLKQIIRPVDRYVHSAKIEKNIIKEINSRDKEDV
jgi:dual-specificity kinase